MTGRIIAMAAFMAAALAGCGADAPESEKPTVRIAAYNAYLNRPEEGGLIADLATPDNPQVRAVAEIIRRVAPDILLLSEFDYDAEGEALALFRANYLENETGGAPPAVYPYAYAGPVNTGVHSGRDLDRNGVVVATPGEAGYGNDAFGYGDFPGQYGMVLLSKYPIDEGAIRTFQTFLWRDMPGALLPDDPETGAAGGWYDEDTLEVLRLSSKSHWDIPVTVGAARLHILAAHPTPPTFDGEEDRNGRRNHDEIRLWADYVDPARSAYLYDDAGARGGLAGGDAFVILGDLNADPADGDSTGAAILQLLDHPLIADPRPESAGGAAAAAAQGGANETQRGDPALDTADFNDDPERGPGNLRIDYVLPSRAGLRVTGAGVFWPAPDEQGYDLVGEGWPVVSSDHRLVWVDVAAE